MGTGVIRLGYPHDREWFAPVTLAGEQPIPQLVIDARLTDAPGGGAIVKLIFTPALVAEKVGTAFLSKVQTAQEKDDL